MTQRRDRTETTLKDDHAAGAVNIQHQSASAIQTELTLRMGSVISSIDSLERAQQITQESLQLEVSV